MFPITITGARVSAERRGCRLVTESATKTSKHCLAELLSVCSSERHRSALSDQVLYNGVYTWRLVLLARAAIMDNTIIRTLHKGGRLQEREHNCLRVFVSFTAVSLMETNLQSEEEASARSIRPEGQ